MRLLLKIFFNQNMVLNKMCASVIIDDVAFLPGTGGERKKTSV
jgi:hypothetical protein